MEQLNDADQNGASNEMRDTILMFGGAALVMLGAGMILASPAIRKYVGGLNPAKLLTAAVPDLQRYLKMKEL